MENNGIKIPTIKIVAKLAGVTPSVVSRVINQDSRLSIREETRNRILQAIKELNFRPNQIARSLRMKSTATIAMVVPDIANPFFAEIIKGAQDNAAKKEYSLILCNTDENALKEKDYIKLLVNKQTDGIILASVYIEDETIGLLQNFNIPYVLVNRTFKNDKVSYVIVDNVYGAVHAVQHLIDLGHKKIAHISGLLYTETGLTRLEGYRKTLMKNKIDFNSDYVVESTFTEQGGYEAMLKLLRVSPLPSAVFASNDLIAFGAIDAIKEHNLSVPEDISVVGFNDIWMAKRITPPLTTVRFPLYDMGRISIEILINKIQKQNNLKDKIILTPELIIRKSTCFLRSV